MLILLRAHRLSDTFLPPLLCFFFYFFMLLYMICLYYRLHVTLLHVY